jgi:putative peptidoglycan lipid II flippase
MNANRSQLTRFMAIFAGGTMLSRVLGLVRDVVVANMPFASREIFLFAFRFPNLLRDMLGEGAVNAAFVPLFARCRETEGEEAFQRLVRACLGATLILFAVLSALGMVLVPLLPRILSVLDPWTGGDSSTVDMDLTLSVMYWLMPYFLLIGAAVFAMGPLFVVKRYGTASWSPVILNIALIAVCLIHRDYFSDPVWALVTGVWLGGIGQVIVMFHAMKKHTGVWLPSLELNHPGVAKAFLLLGPVIVGQATGEVNKLVDSFFAYKLEAVSYLYFSNRLVQLPLSIFGIAVAVSILPAISAAGARDDLKEIRETLIFGFRQSAFLVMPSLVGLLVLGDPLMRLLFVHPGGGFSVEDAHHSANAMFYLAWGLLAFTWVKVAVQGFFAIHDTKSPVIIASLSMALNIVFILLLVKPMGFQGLAFATTLSYAANFFGLYWMLGRRFGSLTTAPFVWSLTRIGLAAGLMGGATRITHQLLVARFPDHSLHHELLSVLLPIGVAMVVYPALALVLRLEDAHQIWGVFRRRMPGGRR